MRHCCTLDNARAYLEAVSTADNAILLDMVRIATGRAELEAAKNYFEPVIETRPLLAVESIINSRERTLHLPRRLLDLTAITGNGTALTVTTAVIPWPPDGPPYDRLRLVSTGASWYSQGSPTDWPNQIRITGVWGVHDDYANAWRVVDAVKNAGGIDADDTSITVVDADGAGEWADTPRFSPGALIRIGDEMLRVTATDTATNALTVVRAENGSTAAAHALDADIELYYPIPAVRGVVARQAGALYSRKSSFANRAILGDGVYDYPPDLLYELRNVVRAVLR